MNSNERSYPRLETLEDRNLLSASMVQAIYRVELARDGDPPGVQYHAAQMAAGASVASVVQAIGNSQEAREIFVAGLYEDVLLRQGSAGEIGSWLAQMNAGMTEAEVEALFYQSDEFFAGHGANIGSFVTNLYLGVLDRHPDAAGWADAVARSAGAPSREAVVAGFFNSVERHALDVQNAFDKYLDREVDAGGLQYYVERLASGAIRRDDLGAIIYSSPEFAGRVGAINSAGYMTFGFLQWQAFTLAQSALTPVSIVPVPVLDPPSDGQDSSVGLTFPEALLIDVDNIYDDGTGYARALPRAGQDRRAISLWISAVGGDQFSEVSYADLNADYSAAGIQPAIDASALPPEGRTITSLSLGHQASPSSFPLVAKMTGDFYLRTTGDPVMGFSSSHRGLLQSAFGLAESFPEARRMYFTPLSGGRAQLLILVESEAFTGAVEMTLTPGANTVTDVRARYFARRTISPATDADTGVAGFSSMFLADERTVSAGSEAHDFDRLLFAHDSNLDGLADSLIAVQPNNPASGIERSVFVGLGRPVLYALEQTDRAGGSYLPGAAYENRASHLVKVRVVTAPTAVTLLVQATTNEYSDNAVALLALQSALPRAASRVEGLYTDYTMVAYFPGAGVVERYLQSW